jgi:hypothetical protein
MMFLLEYNYRGCVAGFGQMQVRRAFSAVVAGRICCCICGRNALVAWMFEFAVVEKELERLGSKTIASCAG